MLRGVRSFLDNRGLKTPLTTYIADVAQKIASDWPASRWDELMPWNWQPLAPKLAQAA